MRKKAEDVQVNDPKKAMQEFTALLGKLVKVPKSELRAKHRRPKRKREV